MNGQTLFSAYDRVVGYQVVLSHERINGMWGIAVSDDELALEWQRYERLRSKLWDAIMTKFGWKNPFIACVICGKPERFCKCPRGFRLPKRARR